MYNLVDRILQADELEIEELLEAVKDRYSALFPDWDINMISLKKSADRNEQLDRMIALLESMKKYHKNRKTK